MNTQQLERLDVLLGQDDVTQTEFHELRDLTLRLFSERQNARDVLRCFLRSADQYAIGDIPSDIHEAAKFARAELNQN